MTTPSWDAVLDACAAHLAVLRDGLAAGLPDVPAPFTPPPGLPPLPPSLADRAAALHAEGVALEAALMAARDRVRAELDAPAATAPRHAATPSMLDARV